MKTNLKQIDQTLEKLNNRLALGYEATCDFSHGYCYALLQTKIINRKEYNALLRVHGYANADGDWFINDKGKLDKYKYES